VNSSAYGAASRSPASGIPTGYQSAADIPTIADGLAFNPNAAKVPGTDPKNPASPYANTPPSLPASQ
jgi:hypothetical protein